MSAVVAVNCLREDQVWPRLHLTCHATEEAVRATMADLRAGLAPLHLDFESVSTVEIAVAEALNNVVEHALPDRPDATIQLELTRRGDVLTVLLRDPGLPMSEVPQPILGLPELPADKSALPEGGFGWMLIHSLTDRLDYRRIGGENCLKMWFSLWPHQG
jgi:serine/threonine-protein kinase RsbW